jgi:hypothetical protein
LIAATGAADMRRGHKMFDDAVAIIAYAEFRAIMLAWAGLPVWNPAVRARALVGMLLAEGGACDLVERAQAALRAESQALLSRRRLAPWPFDHAVGHGQVGNTDGLEAVFHIAAKAAGAYRGGDSRIVPLAINLADFVQRFEQG